MCALLCGVCVWCKSVRVCCAVLIIATMEYVCQIMYISVHVCVVLVQFVEEKYNYNIPTVVVISQFENDASYCI